MVRAVSRKRNGTGSWERQRVTGFHSNMCHQGSENQQRVERAKFTIKQERGTWAGNKGEREFGADGKEPVSSRRQSRQLICINR